MHLVRHELIFKKRKKICLELVESSEGRQDPHGLFKEFFPTLARFPFISQINNLYKKSRKKKDNISKNKRRKKNKEIMRRRKHIRASMMKISVPLARYWRDEFINTMKNQL